MGFPDEVGFKEFADLLADCCIPLRIEPSVLLNDRLVGQIYIKPMNDD